MLWPVQLVCKSKCYTLFTTPHSDDPMWKAVRKALNPAFSPSAIKYGSPSCNTASCHAGRISLSLLAGKQQCLPLPGVQSLLLSTLPSIPEDPAFF